MIFINNMDQPIRLNLASGTNIIDGWFNLDVVPQWPKAKRGCDIIWDARTDHIPFFDNSVSEIYAGYLLLHLAPVYHIPVLSEIYRVLSPEGILLVGEVDMNIVFRRWLENPHDKHLNNLIWGEQGDLGDYGDYRLDINLSSFDKHCQGFTQKSLEKLLLDNKFSNLERIKIHQDTCWYELTIRCKKSMSITTSMLCIGVA